MNLSLRVMVALLLVLAWSVVPTPAYACTPPPGGLPHYTVTEHVKASNAVVEGLVIKTEGEWYPAIATIQVYQYIKGVGSPIIKVRGYFPSSMCGTDVRVDMHAIFYIRTDEFGSYYAMQLSQFDAVIEAVPENLLEAIAASGQDPILITQPTVDAYLAFLARITPGTETPTSTAPSSGPVEPTPAPPTLTPNAIVTITFTPGQIETPSPTSTDTSRLSTKSPVVTLTSIPSEKTGPGESGLVAVVFLSGVILIFFLMVRRRRVS